MIQRQAEETLNPLHRVSLTRKVAVVGLGYVGLMVASVFSTKNPVIGFDVNQQRIADLTNGHDKNGELSPQELARSSIKYSSSADDLQAADFYIIAVPTPLEDKVPNLEILRSATMLVGHYLKKGDIVVYESSVYPGATEEVCIPLLEKESGLSCGRDFGVGYSPERVNPADKEHSIATIPKIISATDPVTLNVMKTVYGEVITAGVFPVSCIRAAEAAKIIENIQRDLNIGFVNEIAVILHRLNLDSVEVFAAMNTKWNHLNFRPGLVGGHCIPFNSYYLVHKAQQAGFKPELILSARKTNENMPQFIINATERELQKQGKSLQGAKVAILGFSYKENTPDVQDTQAIYLVEELIKRGARVQIYDPVVDPKLTKEIYGMDLVRYDELNNLDAAIITVAHQAIKNINSSQLKSIFNNKGVLVDIKGICNKADYTASPVKLWQL